MSDKQEAKEGIFPKDEFARKEIWSFLLASPLSPVVSVAILTAIVLSALNFGTSKPTVIAYCAQDQVYAEPIFHDFEQATGIKVRAVFDSEAVKTVGMANRLLAERGHPQCDVFWGNEEFRTRELAAQDVFRATNGWAAFGYRSRRIVVNTNQISGNTALLTSLRSGSLLELTNSDWRGKIALAYPQFGTTATHFHALRQYWGEQKWEAWCRALAANKPFLVDGNSVVVKLVGSGEAWVGLSDSDDIAEGQRNGLPIEALDITAETLLIPNTIGVVRGCPDAHYAERLFEYLQSSTVASQLVAAGALESGHPAAPSVKTLTPDWTALLRDLDSTTAKLNEIFLR